ncbi:MAG: hypothetical protein AABO58_06920 [Acidobacteriota bacterium]
MNEFVLVTFDGDADVYVDGTKCGITNKKMIVETGEHIFDLGDGNNYAPKSITKQIVGSTIDDPFPIVFGKV